MKLFFKHWIRTVRRSPLQPLLILLTVVLAVALAVTAFRMQFLFEDISKQVTADEAGLGDIVLSMRGDSQVRLMFCEDVRDALGEDIEAQILGEYSLTAFCETENGAQLLSLSGTDLESADRYFLFDYSEYGSFTTQNIKQAAIISKATAAKYRLTVGDTLPLRIMGETVTYTVQAIAADEGVFKERDILVSIDGLVDLLAEQFPTVSVMGTEFEPYNRIFLRFDREGDAEIAMTRLTGKSLFADKQMTLTDNRTREDFLIFMQRSAMLLIALVLLLLCGLLIATCLQLLQLQRSAESAFFYSVGASKRQLWAMQFLENGLYALIGSVGGLFLAHPLLNAAWDLFSMPKETVGVGISGILFGIGFALVLMLGCTALSLHGQKRLTIAEWVQKEESLKRPSEGKYLWLPFAILAVASIISIALVPIRWRYLPGIIAIGCCVTLLYFVMPSILRAYADLMERLFSKGNHPSASWMLAAKNLKQQFALHHVGRLLTSLASILILVSVCTQVIHSQLERFDRAFEGDLIAVNVPKETEEKLRDLSGVEGLARFDIIMSAEIMENYTAMAVFASGDLAPILYHEFLPERMPTEKEAVISRGVAALTGVDVGEEIAVKLDGEEYIFTVSEIQNVHSNFIFLNENAVPTARDLMGISFTEEAEKDNALQLEILSMLESQGVVLMNSQVLTSSVQRLLGGFSNLLQYATGIAIIVSLAGCVNLLIGQFRARKKERELLYMCGMTKGALTRMYAAELILLCIPILLIGLIAGMTLSLLMHYGLLSFGISLFLF